MDHLRSGHLADFVRGLGTAPEREAVEEHLSSGCRKCGKAVGALSKVAAAAAAEVVYSPPETAVRSVWAIFALQQPERILIFPRVVGRLVYDSFRSPLPAGVRARRGIARRVLYRAAAYSLDLRLEHRPKTGLVSMIGQLADSREPGGPLGDLSVYLLCGKKIQASAKSNPFGEFQIEYRPQKRLRLFILAHGRLNETVEVSLSRLVTEGRVAGKSQRRH